MDRYQAIPGTHDFLPAEMSLRNRVESIVRNTFESFGFQEVQTPVLEKYHLLAERAGEGLQKQMVKFLPDLLPKSLPENERIYALRPELTSPVCRLVICNALRSVCPPYKLYYFGPCFRYDSAPEGSAYEERLSEFYQAGIELMGSDDPLADAEVIAAAIKVLMRIGAEGFRLRIGTVEIFRMLVEDCVGSHEFLREYQRLVVKDICEILHIRDRCSLICNANGPTDDDLAYLSGVSSTLQEFQVKIAYSGRFKLQCDGVVAPIELMQAAEETYKASWVAREIMPQDRADLIVNITHIRGSPEKALGEAESIVMESAALKSIAKSIASLAKLREVCDWLPVFGVQNFEIVLGMARSLEFYTGTVFEVDSLVRGDQELVCGGGRYDDLVRDFGGPSTPATGCAFLFDHLVQAYGQSLNRHSLASEICGAVDVLVVSTVTSQECRRLAIDVAEKLRHGASPLRVCVDLMRLGKDGQLKYGKNLKAPFIVLVGVDDFSKGKCKLRQGADEREVDIISLKETIQNARVHGDKEIYI